MKTLLIGNISSYSAVRIKEEFEKRGLLLDMVSSHDVVFQVENSTTRFLKNTGEDLHSYDVYIFRGMGKRIHELSVVARYLKSHGKTIVEDVLTNRAMYIDKFTPTMIDSEIPTLNYTLLFAPQPEILERVEYPIIVKGLDSSMGRKVNLVHNREELDASIEKFKYPIMLQQYVPIRCDYRVMVIDGEPLGAVVRYNKEGDFLTIRAGGKPEAVELPQEALDVAVRATEVAGLTVAGVDLLEHEGVYYRLEVNMSPQFKVFEHKTEVNVAEKIVDAVVKQHNQERNQKVS